MPDDSSGCDLDFSGFDDGYPQFDDSSGFDIDAFSKQLDEVLAREVLDQESPWFITEDDIRAAAALMTPEKRKQYLCETRKKEQQREQQGFLPGLFGDDDEHPEEQEPEAEDDDELLDEEEPEAEDDDEFSEE